jgi:CRP/FNR family transcriptional regulator
MNVAVRLQTTPAFGRLPTQQLVGLAEVLEELRLEAGDPVFAEGDEGDGIYFVYEGSAELYRGEEVIDRKGPGSFFGELSTLDGVPRKLAARASETTVLLRLDREELMALMENQPELAIGMSQFLCTRVRSLQKQMDAR